MKNKGFTLVELLAAVAILMLLITIITPKVIKQLSSAENITQQEQIDSLINIAKIYTNQNTEKLPEKNNISVISIQELIESGLINKTQILDPKTNEELTGCIIIKDENKYKYEYNNKCDQVTVTFDPNGGTIDQTTKNVVYHDTYGTLPTPTREGYTFMGWNGKNMLNLKDRTIKEPGGNFYNTSIRTFNNDGIYIGLTANNYYNVNVKNYNIDAKNNNIMVSSSSAGYGVGMDIKVEPNKKYTASVSKDSEVTIRIGQYQSNGTFIRFDAKFNIHTFTTSQETGIITIVVAPDNGTQINPPKELTNYNIQLEEGEEATPFEPYYITNDTTVVQENNHTLKAIWQANE